MIFVDEVMELVELDNLKNAMVGLPGLSTEQRKRLTIAVELVANPSIIFMDEPTSGINNCATVQPIISVERTVFYRERAVGMYSALPYALPQVIAEIPYVFVQTTYYTLIVYAMVSFQWTAAKFFWFFFVSFLYFTYYGMVTVSITPNHQVASVFVAGLFNIFSGFFIPKPRISKWWIWYYWVCPVAWTVFGLIVSQYGDVEDTIKVPGKAPDPTVKGYVENHFGHDPNFMGPVAGVLVAFTVFFASMYAYCIKTLNFQMR